MMQRVFLFLATNLAVLLVLGVVTRVTGLDLLIDPRGGNLTGLLVVAGIVGMTGSFISLALSKTMAKMSTGAKVISEPRSEVERWLVTTVREQARKAGIGMPEVAVYQSPDMNAFATGMSRNAALVAVSTGLLEGMSRDEVEGVLAHEVAHVANGDMITLSLLQGVLNTFVFFFARIAGALIDNALRPQRDDGAAQGPGIGYWVAVMAAEVVFGLLASIIVMWFSRRREFAADAGGAALAGHPRMISALERLAGDRVPPSLPEGMQAFGIAGGRTSLFARLFMTHPPLEERIAALRTAARQGPVGLRRG
ncbi:MAG TPA: protease HtpX [Gammaproteobacteria bacterium]|nr:protease HtpX [Gammaproteobacteria bacterium]